MQVELHFYVSSCEETETVDVVLSETVNGLYIVVLTYYSSIVLLRPLLRFSVVF